MSGYKIIAKNTFFLLISQIFSIIFNIVYIMIAAQYLGVNGFGIINSALAITAIVGVVIDLGMGLLVTREVSRNPRLAEKYFGNVLFIKSVSTLISLIVLSILVVGLNYGIDAVIVTYVIMFAYVLSSFNGLFNNMFQAFEVIKYQSIGSIIGSTVMVLSAFVALELKLNVVIFSFLYVIVNLSILAYNLLIFRKMGFTPRLLIDVPFAVGLIREALPFAITGVLTSLYFWGSTIILSLQGGNDAVGWYNAAYRLILALLFIPSSFNNSLFPIMSRYFVQSPDSLRLSFEKLSKAMVFMGIPLSIGTFFVASQLILLIYGNQYSNSIVLLKILSMSILLIFSRNAFERLLEASNRQSTVMRIFAVSTLFGLILNIILIYAFSYIGAGIATVITDLTMLALLVYATNSSGMHLTREQIYNTVKIVASGIFMGLILFFTNMSNLFLMVIVSVVAYSLMVVLLHVIENDEMAILFSIIRIRQ